MKVLILFGVSFSLACGFSVDKDGERVKRIATGTDGVAGENLDYVLLSIRFYNQKQTCGGILIHPQFVLTTANCVIDPVEGVASIINATFPQKTTNNMIQKSKIFIHKDFSNTTYADNVALIKLLNATVPDNKTLAVANFSTVNTTDLYKNEQLRICGFGSTANYYTVPTRLQCTDLFSHPSSECSNLPKTICTYWEDRENNACANDYGGALYEYSYVGTKIVQRVVGMASFSPDYRKNTPCKGGQKVIHIQTSFYLQWAKDIIDKND